MKRLGVSNHSCVYRRLPVSEDCVAIRCYIIILTGEDMGWLSMVLRLRQHNIGYTADGFYRSDDPTNSVKALKEGG